MEKVKEWWYNYQIKIIIGSIIILIFLILGIGIWNFYLKDNNEILNENEKLVIEKLDEEIVTNDNQDVVTIDIKGAVNNPGVYTVSNTSRISDVILVSGGLTDFADTSVINLSRKVFDEMVIIIYTKDEVTNFVKVKEEEEKKIETCVIVEEKIINDACISGNDISDSSGNFENNEVVINDDSQEMQNLNVISLNQATLEELMTLSGIGESKANLIIEYREANGGFKSIDELKNIKGIGESIFEKIKDRLTV